jgi:cytochrome c oxidase cbb3-type subunit 3
MIRAALCLVSFLGSIAGCRAAPGQPAPGSEEKDPRTIVDFDHLYSTNCAGCHGAGGKGRAAIALHDPVYLAVAEDATIRRVVANGVPGTPMPAFAQSAGGLLSDAQVDAIVKGMRSRWAKPDALHGAVAPPHLARQPGDPGRGATVYQAYCASCHGETGGGSAKASSIIEGSYLALVSDQGLRTTVIVGRPELGAPDFRNNLSDHPMSDQEVTDVVAWLAAQRPETPGQPYPVPERITGDYR